MSQRHPVLTHTFRAMASPITITIVDPGPGAQAALRRAIDVIEDVAAACTRFDPHSPLMRANAQPHEWHRVPSVCVDAVSAAHRAYVETGGRFDPRMIATLERLGYGESRDFGSAPVIRDGVVGAAADRPARSAWTPQFDGNRLLLGDTGVDLGGIGKGLAVRWAAEQLVGHGAGYLVDAGGDIAMDGMSPTGEPWRIGIENPWNANGEPVAVVELATGAVATSSIRIRSWLQNGKPQHHLIDPATGEPGGEGLLSVSIIGADPATAEVWSKVLFLHGAAGIAAAAAERGLAAIWVQIDGSVGMSEAAQPHVIWSVTNAPQH